MLALYFFLPGIHTSSPVSLPYSSFLNKAASRQVKTVQIASPSGGSNTNITGTLSNGKSFTTVGPPDTSALTTTLRADGVTSVTYSQASSGLSTQLLYWLILLAPLIFVIWLFRRMSRGAAGALQGTLGVGRSRAKVFDTERPARNSLTWRAIPVQRKKSARSSTSSAIPGGISGRARWHRAAC